MGKASAAPQADATTVCPAIGIEVARRATPAAQPTPVGVTVGATLVDRTVGLATEGETTERTAVEGGTAAAQIEVVTETSLIGRRPTEPPRPTVPVGASLPVGGYRGLALFRKPLAPIARATPRRAGSRQIPSAAMGPGF